MSEVFQSYEHYANWISLNWESVSNELDRLILEAGLLIERQNNCNGETHRFLTKQEFNVLESKGFIFVPTINHQPKVN